MKLIEMEGKKFGKLKVLRRDKEKEKEIKERTGRTYTMYYCKCECGNFATVSGNHLRSGHTESCGCLMDEFRAKTKRVDNKYEVVGDYAKIFSTTTDDFFVIDTKYLDTFLNYNWHKNGYGYWWSSTRKNKIAAHQLTCKLEYGEYDKRVLFPDHLSRNRSDNRACNLKLKTKTENAQNCNTNISSTTGVTGVNKIPKREAWISHIVVNGEKINLGYYKNFDDAVKARKEAEKKYGFFFGETTAADFDENYVPLDCFDN